jgi:hypothetical protein
MTTQPDTSVDETGGFFALIPHAAPMWSEVVGKNPLDAARYLDDKAVEARGNLGLFGIAIDADAAAIVAPLALLALVLSWLGVLEEVYAAMDRGQPTDGGLLLPGASTISLQRLLEAGRTFLLPVTALALFLVRVVPTASDGAQVLGSTTTLTAFLGIVAVGLRALDIHSTIRSAQAPVDNQ